MPPRPSQEPTLNFMTVVERPIFSLCVEAKNEEGADSAANKLSDIAYHLEIGTSLAELISRLEW